jgi:excinuclease ABC subunit A
MEKQFIVLEGVRTNNLKNISISIPKNSLVVFTGVSGSGKTSLAFDTIYAESQRRYIESLSIYARRFLDIMPKPDCDDVKGLSPAISVTQRGVQHNPRSTVGIMTEIYDYFRLLFARIGVLHSPTTGLPIVVTPINQIIEQALGEYAGRNIYVMAPKVIKGLKDIKTIQKQGFERIWSNSEVVNVADFIIGDSKKKVDVVIDRLQACDKNKRRLADSLEVVSQYGGGVIRILDADSGKILTFSNKYVCPESGFFLKDIEPSLFSFNNPQGACKTCNGLGAIKKFSESLVVPNGHLNILTGAIKPWAKLEQAVVKRLLSPLFEKHKASLFTIYNRLPEQLRQDILYGAAGFEGVIPALETQYKKTESVWRRIEIGQYQLTEVCPACKGKRLNEDALLVKVEGKTISDVSSLSIAEAKVFFGDLNSRLSGKNKAIAEKIIKEISTRLGFLIDIGLGYITLDRPAPTLSGGESQRINLASQIGSGLTGILYVLDEPSIGLHQRDNARLIKTLKNLRDLGNTVMVIEHDEETILESDCLIDVGPGAGIFGGEVCYCGDVSGIKTAQNSLTGQYLNGRRRIDIPQKRREHNGYISLSGVNTNNLKNLSVEFPLRCFTCVTGVSGCGKSSLVMETLYPALKQKIDRDSQECFEGVSIKGDDLITRVINIDQSPIGRTPRSNPATYTDIFTTIRDFFAALPEAKARRYGVGRFSFNVDGGRCIACKGEGYIKVAMHFMPDVFVECDACKGQRFNEDTLEIKYKDKSIADILALSVDEAKDFFWAIPKLVRKLDFLKDVGLGYIKLGQPATTLSGGEAQRIKLAKELSRPEIERTLYILDEPTTGLHFEDINNLLKVLHKLVDKGNTIVAIEHNMDFIKTADWVIDLGPEGGYTGGQLVISAIPEKIIDCKTSFTGQYLKIYLCK